MKERANLDDFYNEIKDLYIEQKKTLGFVMDFMSTQRNIHASVITYKRKFKEWGPLFQKNTKRGAVVAARSTRPTRNPITFYNFNARNALGAGFAARSLRPEVSTPLLTFDGSPAPQKPQTRVTGVLSHQRRITMQVLDPQNSLNSLDQHTQLGTHSPAPWESSWLTFLDLLEPLGILTRELDKGINFSNSTPLSLSAPPPFLGQSLSNLSGWKLALSLDHPSMVTWAAGAIGNIIPEKFEGQHLSMARSLWHPASGGFPAASIIQLFRLANNFTFWEMNWETSDDLDEPIQTRIRNHDQQVMRLLQDIDVSGNFERVRTLLSIKSYTLDAVKEQIFATAVRSGAIPLVRLLIDAGVNIATYVTSSDGWGNTAIYCAAEIEDETISMGLIQLLLDTQAPMIIEGESELLPAVRLQHLSVVRTLISANAKVCIGTLAAALQLRNLEVLKLILAITPAAVIQAPLPWNVKKLFSKSFWVPTGNKLYYHEEDFTAIGMAVIQGDVELVEILRSAGSSLSETQRTYAGALRHDTSGSYIHIVTPTTTVGVSIIGGHLGMLNYLLGNQVATHVAGGPSPLVTACYHGCYDVIVFLLDNGEDVVSAERPSNMSWSKSAVTNPTLTLLALLLRRWVHTSQLNLTICERLINKGARIDEALILALKVGNEPFFLFLAGFIPPEHLSTCSGLGQLAMTQAPNYGHLDAMEEILRREPEMGFNINPGDIVTIRSVQVLRILERTGILRDVLQANGPGILTTAILSREKALVQHILKHYLQLQVPFGPEDPIDVYEYDDKKETNKPRTPIDAAIFTENYALVEILLQNGALWTTKTLWFAMQPGFSRKMVRFLIDAQSPRMGRVEGKIDMTKVHKTVHRPDLDEDVGIVNACVDKNVSMIKTLLKGLHWGHSFLGKALTAAVTVGCDWDVIKTLLEAGAPLDKPFFGSVWRAGLIFSFTRSPLHSAVYRNDVGLIKHLLRAGADPNVCSGHDITALQLACRCGYSDVVNELLSHDADVNSPAETSDEVGTATALQYAAIGGHFKIVETLLMAGAHINAPAFKLEIVDGGRTALQGAAEKGRIEVLHLLLRWNPKVSGIYRGDYIHAVKLAEEEGHYAAANLLRSYGGWKDQWDCWYKPRINFVMANRDLTFTFPVSEDEHELCEESFDKASSPSTTSTDEETDEGIPITIPVAEVQQTLGSPSAIFAGVDLSVSAPDDMTTDVGTVMQSEVNLTDQWDGEEIVVPDLDTLEQQWLDMV